MADKEDESVTNQQLIYRGEELKRQQYIFASIDLDGDKRCDFHEFYAAAVDHK